MNQEQPTRKIKQEKDDFSRYSNTTKIVFKSICGSDTCNRKIIDLVSKDDFET